MEYNDIINCGWEPVSSPSAEGQSFIKEEYKCQMLMVGSVNKTNAGVCFEPNLTIWQAETGAVLFLGVCNSIEDFQTLTSKYVPIDK